VLKQIPDFAIRISVSIIRRIFGYSPP